MQPVFIGTPFGAVSAMLVARPAAILHIMSRREFGNQK
jgi:hypothetical protein